MGCYLSDVIIDSYLYFFRNFDFYWLDVEFWGVLNNIVLVVDYYVIVCLWGFDFLLLYVLEYYICISIVVYICYIVFIILL